MKKRDFSERARRNLDRLEDHFNLDFDQLVVRAFCILDMLVDEVNKGKTLIARDKDGRETILNLE